MMTVFYSSPISLIILLSPICAIFRWELVDIHLDIESTVVTTSEPIIFSFPGGLHPPLKYYELWHLDGRGTDPSLFRLNPFTSKHFSWLRSDSVSPTCWHSCQPSRFKQYWWQQKLSHIQIEDFKCPGKLFVLIKHSSKMLTNSHVHHHNPSQGNNPVRAQLLVNPMWYLGRYHVSPSLYSLPTIRSQRKIFIC